MLNNQHFLKVSEVELVYLSKVKPSERPRITNSHYAYEVLLNTWDMNKIELVEQFKIVLLNSNNGCLGVSAISMGGISSCIVDKRIIFATALKANAVGLILAHNHPSGNLNPSKIDIDLTAQIAECGKLFEINVLDHIIVTKNGFSSMADNALMP